MQRCELVAAENRSNKISFRNAALRPRELRNNGVWNPNKALNQGSQISRSKLAGTRGKFLSRHSLRYAQNSSTGIAMGRNPTAAQTKFAAGMVAGKSKVDAYAIAHPNDRSKRRTLKNEAYAASLNPVVLAEVERLRKEPIVLECFPDANNPHALRAHVLATMTRLTQYPDPLIAMQAAAWLSQYIDKMESTPAAAGNGQLIADLRGLYQKALKAAPLLETVAENGTPEP